MGVAEPVLKVQKLEEECDWGQELEWGCESGMGAVGVGNCYVNMVTVPLLLEDKSVSVGTSVSVGKSMARKAEEMLV